MLVYTKNNKKQKYIEFFLSFSATVIYSLTVYAQNKIIVIGFSRTNYGEWSLLLTLYTLIEMLPFSALDQGVYRFSYENKNKRSKYLSAIFELYIIILLIQIVIFYVLKNVGLILFQTFNPTIIFFGYCMGEILKNTCYAVYNANRRRGKILFVRCVDLCSTVIGLLFMLKNGLISINGLCIFLFIRNILIIFILVYEEKVVYDLEFFKLIYNRIIFYSLPLLATNIFGYIQNTINKWYLNDRLTVENVALYTVIIGVSYYPPNTYLGIVNNFFLPKIYSRKENLGLKNYILYICTFSLPLIIYFSLLPLLGKYLIIFLYDEKYLDVLPYLKIVSFVACFYQIASFSTFVLRRDNENKRFLLPQIASSIIMISFGYWLILKYGIGGAVANYCIGQMIWSIGMLVASIKHQMAI